MNDFEMDIVETDALEASDSVSSSGKGVSASSGESDSSFQSNPDEEIFGLGSVPNEWDISSLPSAVDIEMGSSPPSSTYNEEKEGLPFYQGNADFGHMTPKVSTWCSDPVKTADEGDVLISIRAPVGDLNIADEHCCIGRGLAALRPDRVNGLYLFYGLAQRSRWLSRLASGSTFKSVSSADLEKVDLPVPPFPEQRKIASVLYTVDQAIQKTEEIIEQAKRVKRGVVQNIFTDGFGQASSRGRQETSIGEIPEDWKLVRLSDVANQITDGPHQSVDRLPEGEEGIPFLYVSCVRHGEIIWEKAGSISEEVYDQILNRVDSKPGSILYTIVGSYGRAALVEEDRPFGFERNIGFIDANASLISPSYLAHWMNSSRCKNYAERVAQGNAQKLIALHSLSNFPVPLPSRETQEKIANLLSTFDGKIRGEEKSKRRLKRLKRGLMQDLLTGEVRTADKAIEVLGEVAAHG